MKQMILLTFALLFVVSLVSATQVGGDLNTKTNETQLRITINNPIATFSVNESDVISYYIEFTNKNDFSLDINVDSDAKNIQFTNSVNLHLMPNDTIRTTYNITAVKSEDVVINAKFTGNGKSFGASQRITIRLVRSQNDGKLLLYYVIPVVLIISLIVIFLIWRNYKKKNRASDHSLDRTQMKYVMPADAVTHLVDN